MVPSSGLHENEAKADEVDGDSVTRAIERNFYLPLIKTFDTCVLKSKETKTLANKDNYTRERRQYDSDIVFTKQDIYFRKQDVPDTVPSKRVARTIDFSPSNSLHSPTESPKTFISPTYPFSPLYCSPSQFLSLSPVTSYPFRQNELASPEAPLTPANLTTLSPKFYPQTFFHPHVLRPVHAQTSGPHVTTKDANSPCTTEAITSVNQRDTGIQLNSEQTKKINQQNHLSSLSFAIPTSADVNNNKRKTQLMNQDLNPQNAKISEASNNTESMQHHQTITSISQSAVPAHTLWRPVPQMVHAVSSGPSLLQPLPTQPTLQNMPTSMVPAMSVPMVQSTVQQPQANAVAAGVR